MVDVVVRFGGTAGEGVLLCADLLANAATRCGFEAFTMYNYAAEIRGDAPSSSQVRLADHRILSQGDAVDVFVALNSDAWALHRHDLRSEGALIYDATPIGPFGEDETFDPRAEAATRLCPVPLLRIANRELGFPQSKNMVALGALARVLGLSLDVVRGVVKDRLVKKSERVLAGNLRALELGHEKVSGATAPVLGSVPLGRASGKLIVSGNEAVSLGAIAAGCRFFASYPITPASEVLHLLARELPAFGGHVVQAEDEMAALGMALGASYAGSKAMTATSGPGLSLMTELLDLAAMAEVPVVIVDVQRAGPSTGMPTKTEQSDLNLALYGGHGEAPRLVVSPTSVLDCFYQTVLAFNLAEKYQMPVLLLSDQFLGQRRETVDEPSLAGIELVERTRPSEGQLAHYRRYGALEGGTSPMSQPGQRGGLYIATGLEHKEDGQPRYEPKAHRTMTERRFSKVTAAAEPGLCERWGPAEGEVGVIAWGSSVGAVQEGLERLAGEGLKAVGLFPKLLSPLPAAEIADFARSVRRLLVAELNYTGQLAAHLRALLGVESLPLRLYEGRPLNPAEVVERVRGVTRA